MKQRLLQRRGTHLLHGLVIASLAWQAEALAAAPGTGGETTFAPRRHVMVSRVDALLADRWKEAKVQPAPPTDDATFLRRIHLDLVGVVPPVARARAFLADPDPAKRSRLIDDLLASPGSSVHLATTWRTIMLRGIGDVDHARSVIGLQAWLQKQFARNASYDNLVADLMVARGGNESGPALFFTAMELNPERLAANTARIFMGLRIECAQCHNHPFDHWTQEDFWGYAAFFARLRRTREAMPTDGELLIDSEWGEVTLPRTSDPVRPRFPSGEEAEPTLGGSRRAQLAIWLVSRENPYLAPAAVNWAWAHMFGRGLVDPVDDLGSHNPASHPQLFRELTEYFVETGFDLRQLLRTLANTRAYQLSSEVGDELAIPPELFARMLQKPLSPDQLYDSLSALRARPDPGDGLVNVLAARILDPERVAFITKMQAAGQSAHAYEGGVPQALTLMNGRMTAEITHTDRSRVLASLEAPFFSDEDRLESLYLATLTRFPREEEKQRLLTILTAANSDLDREEILADILWAIVNSAEYLLNH